jgi:2-phosphoglycerate kinase|tara:strand:- start:66 stop:632 length:567 start_codon:yes stop_codon:yes gene_type:complete
MSCFDITLIGGEPCTGKSTLVRRIKNEHNVDIEFQYKKLLKGYRNKDTEIMGIYNEELFDGTDRLSMAVQPVFLDYIEQKDNDRHVILEGDRLFKKSLIENLSNGKHNFRIIILKASENSKKHRHETRMDDQTEKWLNSKKTTIKNIEKAYKHSLFQNENETDCKKIMSYIMTGGAEREKKPSQCAMF